MRVPFIWKDVEHWTLPDIVETLCLIDSQEDADDFMQAYSLVCDHAEHNIGYMADLISVDPDFAETAENILKLFDVELQIVPMHVFNDSSLGLKKSVDKPVEA